MDSKLWETSASLDQCKKGGAKFDLQLESMCPGRETNRKTFASKFVTLQSWGVGCVIVWHYSLTTISRKHINYPSPIVIERCARTCDWWSSIHDAFVTIVQTFWTNIYICTTWCLCIYSQCERMHRARVPFSKILQCGFTVSRNDRAVYTLGRSRRGQCKGHIIIRKQCAHMYLRSRSRQGRFCNEGITLWNINYAIEQPLAAPCRSEESSGLHHSASEGTPGNFIHWPNWQMKYKTYS